MRPDDLSSGDSIVDRRADYARMLAESGDWAGAAELMEQALELAPRWAAGWFSCGAYRERVGDNVGAIAAFENVVALDTADLFGATLKLAALGAVSMPDHPSSRYIERFFDDYADRFDRSLVEKLDYQVPAKLAALLADAAGLPQNFELVTDLGCGTGLFGGQIRSRTGFLEGFDLSGRMLAKAAAKGLYDHLAIADLSLPAQESGLFGERAYHRADLVVATDVMIYLGNLDPVFSLTSDLATAGAIFAFSIESTSEGEGYRLESSLRYAHSVGYVEAMCAKHGFHVCLQQSTTIRMDAGKPIPGLLFVTRITS